MDKARDYLQKAIKMMSPDDLYDYYRRVLRVFEQKKMLKENKNRPSTFLKLRNQNFKKIIIDKEDSDQAISEKQQEDPFSLRIDNTLDLNQSNRPSSVRQMMRPTTPMESPQKNFSLEEYKPPV